MRRSLPGSTPDDIDVTTLLKAWAKGDAQVEEQLIRAVYPELHRQAERAMRAESPAHTLQPTELVTEAYLRLIDQRLVTWQNRAHFFGITARLMRRVLVDHARARLTGKRGGGMQAISLDESSLAAPDSSVDVLALHDAIEHLATIDPQGARVVELRYFGG